LPADRGGVRHTVRMAYDVELADRLRAVLAAEPALTEKRMFGGLAFLVRGHLAVSASGQGGLLLRVDPARAPSLLGPSVTRFVMRGRELDGWLHVAPAAVGTDDALRSWVAHGLSYARSLPPK
jgi:TfoX-like protein